MLEAVFFGILFLVILLVLGAFAGLSTKLRQLLIYLLVLVVLLGPRIPIGDLSASQRIDIRLDDLIMLILVLAGILLASQKKIRIKYPQYMTFLFLYLIIALISSIIGPALNGLPLLLSIIFWLRDIEYIAIAFLMPLIFNNLHELTKVSKVYAAAMAINILWLIWQLITNNYGPLIEFVEVGRYGIALVGEGQVAIAAAMYSFSLLFFSVYWVNNRSSLFAVAFILGSTVGVIGTVSRGTIFSIPICLAVLALLLMMSNKGRVKNILIGITTVAAVSLIAIFSLELFDNAGLGVRRLETDVARESLENVRMDGIWLPLLEFFYDQPIIGYGKGQVGNLIDSHDEAHNYYLRLLIETGLIGTIVFVVFLLKAFTTSLSLYRKSEDNTVRFVSMLALVIGTNVVMLSVGNDILNTSAVAMFFYMVVGFVNIAYLEHNKTLKSI